MGGRVAKDTAIDPELTKVTLYYATMAKRAELLEQYARKEGVMSEAMDDCVPQVEANKKNWPDPTPQMLKTPAFNAVWDVIKTWDINVPEVDGELYTHATGNHVRAILDALPALPRPAPKWAEGEHLSEELETKPEPQLSQPTGLTGIRVFAGEERPSCPDRNLVFIEVVDWLVKHDSAGAYLDCFVAGGEKYAIRLEPMKGE